MYFFSRFCLYWLSGYVRFCHYWLLFYAILRFPMKTKCCCILMASWKMQLLNLAIGFLLRSLLLLLKNLLLLIATILIIFVLPGYYLSRIQQWPLVFHYKTFALSQECLYIEEIVRFFFASCIIAVFLVPFNI